MLVHSHDIDTQEQVSPKSLSSYDGQDFQLNPATCNMQEEKPVHSPRTDWSRTTRNHLLLMKSASDGCQTKITSYFDLIDDVTQLAMNSPELKEVFSTITDQNDKDNTTSVQNRINNFSGMLKN